MTHDIEDKEEDYGPASDHAVGPIASSRGELGNPPQHPSVKLPPGAIGYIRTEKGEIIPVLAKKGEPPAHAMRRVAKGHGTVWP